MKILFVTPSYKPAYVYGGPTVSVSELAANMVSLGHEVTVYTTTANGEEDLDVPTNEPIVVDGVIVYYFRRQTGDHTHISLKLWKKFWTTAQNYDVIHLQSWWSLLIFGVAFLCRLKKRSFVVSPRGMLSRYSFVHQHSFPKKALHFLFGKRLLQSSILHATTQLEWNDCQAVQKPWEGFVLPNLVRLPSVTLLRSRPAQANQPVMQFGFLSRIDPKKGLELLFEGLAKSQVDFCLRIAGTGSADYINHLIALSHTLNISDKVEWCGWMEGEEKFRFLRSIDVFALTSYNENFANVVIESLSVGTPVLLSDGVGLAEFVRDQSLGWICTLEADSIASSISQIDGERNRIDQIRVKAPELVNHYFDKKRIGQQYIKAYEDFCFQ